MYFPSLAPSNRNLGIATVLLCLVAFSPIFVADFVNYDDPTYVIDNVLIRHLSWANIKSIFTGEPTILYVPLTILSYLFERTLLGPAAPIFHSTNLLLHIANSLLLLRIVALLPIADTPVKLLAVIFFALHPLVTESVCWITERKDVLYCFFYFLSFIFFLKYRSSGSRRQITASFLLFALSCLSKPMAVSLPIFFFLYDYITGRMQRLRQLLYLAPFFACSLLFSIISIVRVSNAALSPDKTLPLPLGEKLILLVAEIGFYFTRPFGFWQQHLTYLIPPAGSLAHAPQLVLYSILGVIVAGLFLYIIAILKDKLMTSLILGWLAFLSPILQLYPNTHSYVSERYFYISIIFPVFILYRLASPVIRKWQPWFYALIAIFCFWSVLRSHGRSRDWRNSETLFSHEIAVNPENSLAYNSLAQYYNTNGRFPDAMILLQKALELEPNNPYYLTNLGWALGATGHTDLAIDMLSKAIAIRGDIVQAYNNLAVCYVFKNDDHKALDCLSAAYKIDPKNSDILYNLGICYSRAGMEETALIYFKRASQLGNRTAERFAK